MKLEPEPAVLLFASEPAEARLLSQVLVGAPDDAFVLLSTSKVSDALQHLRTGSVRAIILDIDTPVGGGLEIFEQLFAAARHLPFLILCGAANEHLARDAVHRGAGDYFLKSQVQQSRLRRAVNSLVKQHAAMEAAFFSQQCADAMLDCTAESVLVSDNTGRIIHLNSSAETATGWRHAEAIGRTLGEVFPLVESCQPGAPETLGPAPEFSAAKNVLRNVGTLTRRTGELLSIRHDAFPIRDRRGNIAGGLVVFHDVSAANADAATLSSSST